MRAFMRWFLYSAVLVFLYACECNPLISGWCPLFIIPLATAVAMHEGELAAGIFGAVCGLLLDMANGVSVVGFSSMWLLAACPLISLLARFWVKVNPFSHLVINAAVCVIMGLLDTLFLHWVWEGNDTVISITRTIIPEYGWAVIFSVPIYLLVRLISVKLRPKEERRLEESAQAADEYEEQE